MPVVELQVQVEGLAVGLLGVGEAPLILGHHACQVAEMSEFALEVGPMGGALGAQCLVEEVSSAGLLVGLVEEVLDRCEDGEDGLGGG